MSKQGNKGNIAPGGSLPFKPINRHRARGDVDSRKRGKGYTRGK